jgi:hypothetical protein
MYGSPHDEKPVVGRIHSAKLLLQLIENSFQSGAARLKKFSSKKYSDLFYQMALVY